MTVISATMFPGGQPSAQQQQQQQQLQRLIAMGAIPAGMAPLPGAGLALQAGFQQASQLQLQAALAQNPALQAQFAHQVRGTCSCCAHA